VKQKMNTNLEHAKKEHTRHYGIDLLRILCMFMILFLHYFCYGRLRNLPNGQLDIPGAIMWWMYALTYVAVGCYVLISGYFLVDQPFRISKIIKLLLQVYFYSMGIAAVLLILGKTSLSFTLMRCVLPISFRHYWFITAYLGLNFLLPFFNRIIRMLSKKQHLGLLLVVFLMLSLWRDVIPTVDSPFFSGATYSLPLFIELYLIAAYVRLYVDVQKIRRPIVGYFFCTFAVFVVWLVLRYVYANYIDLSADIPSDYYYRNHSALVVVGAVCLFVTFLKLRITNRLLIKLIKLVSPLTLGVYLIHEHYELRMLLWNRVVFMAGLPRNILTPVLALLVTVVLYTVLLAVDFVRAKLFGLLESTAWYQNLMKKADNLVSDASEKLLDKIGKIGE
jgi:surface polysaccharide O-acyltransferase-like enzyme